MRGAKQHVRKSPGQADMSIEVVSYTVASGLLLYLLAAWRFGQGQGKSGNEEKGRGGGWVKIGEQGLKHSHVTRNSWVEGGPSVERESWGGQ